MTLGLRKVLVIALVGGIFLLANIMIMASWLQRSGVIEGAAAIRRDFLTGTAISVIIALIILLVKPRGECASWLRRCAVCDHRLLRGKYCGECGSKA